MIHMTKLIFFDTDCLSSFLWVDAMELLVLCFPQGFILPRVVYEELKKVPHLHQKVDVHVQNNNLEIMDIESGTANYRNYVELVSGRDVRVPRIGKGEAAAIVLAQSHKGILASNNLADITYYIEFYNLEFLTSASILEIMYQRKIIDLQLGESIWSRMLQKRRRLPCSTFQEYLDSEKYSY